MKIKSWVDKDNPYVDWTFHIDLSTKNFAAAFVLYPINAWSWEWSKEMVGIKLINYEFPMGSLLVFL